MTPEELVEAETKRKDRELDLKEREVAAKEKEVSSSRWANPLVIGLFAAAAGLIGNVVVARVNNQNTQAVEHLHAQSSLIFEAIKTNGDSTLACNNLLFFVNLGLLDDPNKTIRTACPSDEKRPPSLPASSGRDKEIKAEWESVLETNIAVKVVDEDGHPIESAEVLSWPVNKCLTNAWGNCFIRISQAFNSVTITKTGYETVRTALLNSRDTQIIKLHKIQ